MKTLKIYNTLIAQIASDSSCWTAPVEDYASELFDALEKDGTDLAEYAGDYHGATYYKKLRKITMSAEWVGSKLYGLATCEVEDDWTDDDTAQLKEYLTGQYSDGYVQYTKMFSSIDKHLKTGGFINQTEHNCYSEFSISISKLSSFQSIASCGFNSG